ncbi:adenylyltransferase/cytidyltransferase family protein [Candidatus Shapirobacteria bacterium]|nr:adenylyltransferase/cytidyltransferase family protein [Candidatus Shapirobacteria bacterium]
MSEVEIIKNALSLGREKITPLPGGWRKKTFLVEGKDKRIVSLVSKKAISKSRLLKAAWLEEKLTRKKIILGRKLISLSLVDNFHLIIRTYLEGKPKWQWGRSEARQLGELLARLHQKGIYHLDLKPGNVLWRGNKISGVIDFEESKRGKKYRVQDLVNTLSWVLASGGEEDIFLKAYLDQGGKVNYGKMEKYLPRYLMMRAKQGSKNALILLAKKKLEDSQGQIKKKLLKFSDLVSFRKKNKGKKIVLVVGAWELLHWGHLYFLKKAKKRGDLLVVGVASDESRQRLKGESFPIVGEKTRAETMAFFDFVDGTVILAEDQISKELKSLKPDILYAVKKDWREGIRKKEEEELVKNWGGRVVKTSYLLPGVSSSGLVERVALLKIKQVLLGERERQPLLKVNGKSKNKFQVKYQDLGKLGNKLKKQGKSVVFTALTADLFHLGHARFIQKAKSVGDVLIVGVPSNRSVRELKGKSRPMIDETARSLLLGELSVVDYVVIFDERTILGCLQKLKPDLFFTVKDDWNTRWHKSSEAQFMKSIGGMVVRSERQAPYISASKMIDKAAGDWLQKEFAGLLKTAQQTPVLNADFDPHDVSAQLAAREKGFYEQVLQAVAQRNKCVFCDLKEKYIVAKKNNWILTVALYPYIDGHLLIIPKKHLESAADLTKKDQEAVFALEKKGRGLLKKALGINNFWFILREGKGIKVGKTVEHLHFHLMPYDPGVIKMVDKKLTTTPLKIAQKLREKNE